MGGLRQLDTSQEECFVPYLIAQKRTLLLEYDLCLRGDLLIEYHMRTYLQKCSKGHLKVAILWH